MNRRRRSGWCAVLLFGLALPTAPAGLPPTAQDESQEQYEQGQSFIRQNRFEDALKAFKKANELRDKRCATCWLGMARAYEGLGASKNVVESANKAAELAGDDTRVAAVAKNLRGVAFMALAENKDMKDLAAAEASFRESLTLTPGVPVVVFNLGVCLLRQNKDSEGVAELKNYLQLAPRGPSSEAARKFIENPRRARENYAPDFSLTTAQGEYLSNEELAGKIVVLDFWATWCQPCVAAVSSLRNMNKKFNGQPFVMISVSSDSDDDKWRAFVDKQKMIWPQHLDRDRKVHRAFSVRAWPTYVVVDHEGIVRFRTVGSGWQQDSDVERKVRDLLKDLAKKEK